MKKLFENYYVMTVLNWTISFLRVIEFLFLCSVIAVSLVCLVHILMGQPFSIHIPW